MTREMMKRVEIDEYIKKCQRDYIIDPMIEVSYIIMKDDSVSLSLLEDQVLSKEFTRQDILYKIKEIIAKPIW